MATLGIAWTDSQFGLLKKFTSSVCFISDSDVADGKAYGPGFEAVMANGAAAIRKGFHVTVRELPFAKAPVSDDELRDLYTDGIPDDAVKERSVKNDADSYIRSKEDFSSLEEKHFIIWLAHKQFLIADSLVEERKCVSEIADLFRYVDDQLVFDQCIEQLSKLHGKAKLCSGHVAKPANGKITLP